MRIVSFMYDGKPQLGLRVADGVKVLGPYSLDDLIRQGPRAVLELVEQVGDKSLVIPCPDQLLPPLSYPSKVLCVGLNYHDHTAEAQMDQPDYPTVFARFASGFVGHGENMAVPLLSHQLDFEGELVAIIGKRAYQVSPEDALEYVAGYSIFNDGSIRDYQKRTTQWTVGKNFDATGAFGPDFVTTDEVSRGASGLQIETRLNGEIMQSANTSDMIFSVAELISIFSNAMTLMPGDMIVTGTPAGVGVARTPPIFMKKGDVCEVSIEGLGTLRNPII